MAKKAQIESRLFALIIDAFILSFLTEAINKMIHVPFFHIGYSVLGGVTSLGAILTVLYFGLMEGSSRGATIGKQVMKIRVTTLNGQRLSYRSAFLRGIGRLVPLGWLLVFTQDGRALHDYMGGSHVVDDLPVTEE